MRMYISLLCCCILLPCQAVFLETEDDLTEETQDVSIKVLLKEDVDGALVDIEGGYTVINPKTQKRVTSGFLAKRAHLETSRYGIRWGETFVETYQIKIIPKRPETTILVDGTQYRGSLECYMVDGKLHIINDVNVEDFVKSALSVPFFSSHIQSATLDALCILERTNLYYARLKSTNPYWDIQAQDFNYQGCSMVVPQGRIDQAVDSTKQLVLLYRNRPFPTAWTEHCAGKTAAFSTVFRRSSPGPGGVAVSYSQKEREKTHWKCVITKEDLAQKLHVSRVNNLDLFQDPATRKVYAIKVGNDTQPCELPFSDFQTLIGSNRIVSNDFQVTQAKDRFVFSGYGKGSGVGLCLFAADQMAKIGDAAPAILAYFYPDTQLVKLSQGTTP